MLPPRPCRGPSAAPIDDSAADAPPVLPAASFEDDNSEEDPEDASPEHDRPARVDPAPLNPALDNPASTNSVGDNPERVTFPGPRCMREPSTALSVARWKGNETPKRGCRTSRAMRCSSARGRSNPRAFDSISLQRISLQRISEQRSSSTVRCRGVERVLRMIRCQGFAPRDADRRPRHRGAIAASR